MSETGMSGKQESTREGVMTRWRVSVKSRLIAGGLAAALLGVMGLWALASARSGKPDQTDGAAEETASGPVSASVETVQLDRIPSYLEVPGTVAPRFSASLAAKVMGRVVSLPVAEGDAVRAGQPLVWLDSRDLSASVDQAEAGAKAARVGVETAVVAARMERSAADARVEAARAMVDQAQAGLQAARARLDMVRSGPRKQERAQAALAAAQARAAWELAVADHDRMKVLFADGAVSKQQYDASRTRMDVAKAQLESALEAQSLADEGSRAEDIRTAEEGVRQAEAALEAARQSLKQSRAAALMADVRDKEIAVAQAQVRQGAAAVRMARVTRDMAVIRAPFDAVVARRMADPGTMATPGVPLLVLHGGGLRFEAATPESALTSARIGSEGEVVLDALGGRRIGARVVEVTPQGDPGSHSFIVKLALPDGLGAMAGMFGRARFVTGHEEAITLPASAVWEREGLRYVYVVSADRRARIRLVTVGKSMGSRVVILSGLTPGERVVTGGVQGIVDGTVIGN